MAPAPACPSLPSLPSHPATWPRMHLTRHLAPLAALLLPLASSQWPLHALATRLCRSKLHPSASDLLPNPKPEALARLESHPCPRHCPSWPDGCSRLCSFREASALPCFPTKGCLPCDVLHWLNAPPTHPNAMSLHELNQLRERLSGAISHRHSGHSSLYWDSKS